MSLTGLVILPALTKNYSALDYGLWAQMIATVGFLRLLTLKFDSAIIRFLSAEDDKGKRREAMGTMLWPIIALIALGVVVCLTLKTNLAIFLFTNTIYANFVALVFIWASLDALFLFTLAYLRARDRIRFYSVIRLVSSIVRMLVVFLIATSGFDFYWLVLGVIIAQVVFVSAVFVMIFRELSFLSFSFSRLKTYLLYSIPMLPGTMLYWVIAASDRYLISHMLDLSQTGIYAASASLANLIMLLAWPIGMVLFPSVSRLWERGESEKVKGYFQYSLKLYLVLALPTAFGLFILSQPLLRLLATSEFAAGGMLVLLLSIGIVFSGVYLINEYTVYLAKKTAWLPIITLTGAAINLSINIVLIPRLGILGAAVGNIAAYLTISAILIYWGRKMVNYQIDFISILKVIAATLIMSASLWFLKPEKIWEIAGVIVLGSVIYIVSLHFLRAFSGEDRKVIKKALSGFGFRTGTDV